MIVGLDRSTNVPLVLRLLCDREKLLRVAANLLLAGSNILHFFPGTKDNGCPSPTDKQQSTKQKNKQSNSHGTSQGSCLFGSVKGSLAQKNLLPRGRFLDNFGCFFLGCPAHMMSWLES